MIDKLIERGIRLMREGRIPPGSAHGRAIVRASVRRDPVLAVHQMRGIPGPELETALTETGFVAR